MHGVMMQLWYVQLKAIRYFYCTSHVQLVKDKTRKQIVPWQSHIQVHSGLDSLPQHSAICIIGHAISLQAKVGIRRQGGSRQ